MVKTISMPYVGTAISSAGTSSVLTKSTARSIAALEPKKVGGKTKKKKDKEAVDTAVAEGSGATESTGATTTVATPSAEKPFYENVWFVAIVMAALIAGGYFFFIKK